MSDQKNPRQVFERVITLLKSGARAEAESLCRESIQRDPGDVNFRALLGTILAERNEWRGSRGLPYVHAIQCGPGSCACPRGPGDGPAQPGPSMLQALPLLQKAAALMPNNPGAFTKLGGALICAWAGKQAAQQVRNGSGQLALSPAQAKLEQASHDLFAEGKFRAAEQLAQEIIQDNPMDVNAALVTGPHRDQRALL